MSPLASARPDDDRWHLLLCGKEGLAAVRASVLVDCVPSACWITYLFSALTARGHGAEVVAYIRRHWATMADCGSTWENFVPERGAESRSHAWSAHPLFHLMQTVGGVIQRAPAWREINFRPVFHGDRARVTVPSPAVCLGAAWECKPHGIVIKLDLPSAARGTIHLPGHALIAVTGDFETTLAPA